LHNGSIFDIEFKYYNKVNRVRVEILDNAIVNTTPKTIDFIQKALANNKKRQPSITSATEQIQNQSERSTRRSRRLEDATPTVDDVTPTAGDVTLMAAGYRYLVKFI